MTMKYLVVRENDQSFKQDLITTHDILLKNLFSLQLKACAIDPLWTNQLLIFIFADLITFLLFSLNLLVLK